MPMLTTPGQDSVPRFNPGLTRGGPRLNSMPRFNPVITRGGPGQDPIPRFTRSMPRFTAPGQDSIPRLYILKVNRRNYVHDNHYLRTNIIRKMEYNRKMFGVEQQRIHVLTKYSVYHIYHLLSTTRYSKNFHSDENVVGSYVHVITKFRV